MTLEQDAPVALFDIRESFSLLAASASIADPRPVSLSDQLGLHKSLARKLSHLITADSPLQVWECIPGDAGVNIALEACARVGASTEAAQRVRRSLEALESVVRQYATSDHEFRRMIAQIDHTMGTEAQLIAKQERERAYEGSAATLGITVDTVARIDVLMPANDAGDADLITAKGFVNLMRLRKGQAFELARSSILDMQSGKPLAGERTPLDSSVQRGFPPLWSRLSTIDHRLVERVQLTDRVASDRLGELPTGVPGRGHLFFAERVSGMIERFRSNQTHLGSHTHRIRFPAKSLSLTLILHKSLAGPIADASVHSIIASDPGDPAFDWDCTRIPCQIETRPLGPDLSWAATPSLPDAESAVAELITATGYPRGEFVGHRVEIEYPPVFSAVRVQYELPAHPANSL